MAEARREPRLLGDLGAACGFSCLQHGSDSCQEQQIY
jgi:hypothetical protein